MPTVILVRLAFFAALVAALAAPAAAQDPNLPSIVHPSASLQVDTGTLYVEIEVLDGETYEVWYRQDQTGTGVDVASQFTLKTDLAGSKQRRHASLSVPVGTHDVEVIQSIAAQPSYAGSSGVRAFSRAAATATAELGLLTGTAAATPGKVTTQALGGTVQRSSPADRLFVFGNTTLNGGAVHPATLATSTDVDPLDGLALAYHDEGGTGSIVSVLPLVAGEQEIRLTSPFLNGSDVYSFYWRFDHTAGKRELGLAKMAGGTPPFVRVSFPPSGGWFGDSYSIFRDGEVQPVGSATVSGSTVYLYGTHRPAGATTDRAFVARVAANAAENKSSYQYWTDVSGTKAWRSTATAAQLVPLWENTGVPTVQWNVALGRWVAIHAVESASVAPYGITDSHSALAYRVAANPEGRWSPPGVLYGRPQTAVGGLGTVRDPAILPGLDDGKKVFLAATDAGSATASPNAKLYRADLANVVIPPVLDAPPATITANPYSVTGYAAHGDTVRLYVGGVLQGTTTASTTDGAFAIPAALVDGAQPAYAVAVSGTAVSAPSNTVTLTYQNNVSRSIATSTISVNTVWTPGSAPGTTGPYVINGTLTVGPTATLTLMPGVVVKFDVTGVDNIAVNGTLQVLGTGASYVTFQRNGTSTSTWDGVTVNATGTAVIDRAIFENAPSPLTVTGGGLLTISNTEVRDFAVNGITASNSGRLNVLDGLLVDGTTATGGLATRGLYFTSAGVSNVAGATVRDCQTGMLVTLSSPAISASTFTANTTGITVNQTSAPSVTGSTITLNATGVSVSGSGGNPNPTLYGNDIHSNTTADLTASAFTNALAAVVDAKDNWWGVASPETISDHINDQTDTATAPTVDWRGFRASSAVAGGSAVPGTFLIGPTTGTIAAGTYTVLGDVIVPTGASLELAAGAELRFVPETRIYAAGTLTAAGTISDPVHLVSSKAAPAAGDWEGVYVDATSVGTKVDFAVIEHVYRGVEVHGAAAEINDTTVRWLGRTTGSVDLNAGITLDDSASLVQRNVVDNTGVTGRSTTGIRVIYAVNSTKVPVIDGNTLSRHMRGINVVGPSSGAAVGITILQNTIEQNTHGIRLTGRVGTLGGSGAPITANFIRNNTQIGIEIDGTGAVDPYPLVTGNDIHGNTTWNLRVGSAYPAPNVDLVVATGNWWGTTDLAAIRADISDQRNVATAAVADWSSPLDASIAAGGVPISGNFIAGPLPSGTTLTAGATYDVLSVLTIPAGSTLAIPAGTTLRFQLDTAIEVSGTLTLDGALLTSAAATPAAADWDGIRINASSTGTTVTGVTIRYAEQPIVVTGATATVSAATIRTFSTSFSGILYQTGAGGSIDGCDIDNATNIGKGVRLNASNPSVSNNVIRNVNVGIELQTSTATITSNTLESNNTGINLLSGASPTISGGNVIRDNVTSGIALSGVAGNATLDPKPVIHGNQIRDNNVGGSGYNVRILNNYGNPATVIDAELNDWGSTDPVQIAAWIRDNADASTYAIVDFSPYLDANGNPVGGGNLLSGTLAANTTLATGSSWSMVSNVTVPSGITLTVQAGADVTVAPGSKLTVSGALVVAGTSVSRAVFRSSEAVPTSGAWEGIAIASGGTASIDYADIRHGRQAVSAVSASGTVSITNTLIADFGRAGTGGAGIWIQSSLAAISNNTFTHPLAVSGTVDGIHLMLATAGTTITGNSIQAVTRGLYIDRSSPSVQGNAIFGTGTGIYVGASSSPTITNQNSIHDNQWGIQVFGSNNVATDPAPTVNGNDIYSNDELSGVLRNFSANSFGSDAAEIDATGNWWGTTDPVTIASGVLDRGDAGYTNGAFVDFVPFLGASAGAGGTPVAGNFLTGVSAGSTTLTVGTWDVLGTYLVAPGGTLTVPAGTTVRVIDGATLDVEGTLSIQGTTVSPVLVTSRSASPTRGIWEGIKIHAGTASVIDHAEIRWASRGVWIDGASAAVSNSWIRDFELAGIYMTNAGGTLSGNTIDNTNDTANGIHLGDSSPAITANDIRNTQVGILMQGASNPVVSGHNVITSNRVGIQLNGLNAAQPNPNPVVNGNDIFGNVWIAGDVRNLQLSGYWDPDDPTVPSVLNFRNNWWGSTDPETILAGIEDQSGQPAAVDVSGFLTSAGGSPSTTPVFTVAVGNVRRSANVVRPGLGESVAILFDLATDASVTLKIFDEDDGTIATPVRTITQSFSAGSDRSILWDGRDSQGALVNEDAYGYALVATDALRTTTWNPPRSGAPNAVVSMPAGADAFNTFRHDFWQKTATVTKSTGRIDLIATPAGTTTGFKIYDQKPLAIGTHLLIWDGRDASGQLVAGTVNLRVFLSAASTVLWNNVVVEDVEPNVTGVAPSIEVKSNPWLVVHSYGQLAKISYHVDQSSLVTVKLLPPGISDPGHASAIPVISATPQTPGDYTVEWTGAAPSDPNLIRSPEEGAFTFAIQAVSQSSGRSSLYRGVLQLRR